VIHLHEAEFTVLYLEVKPQTVKFHHVIFSILVLYLSWLQVWSRGHTSVHASIHTSTHPCIPNLVNLEITWNKSQKCKIYRTNLILFILCVMNIIILSLSHHTHTHATAAAAATTATTTTTRLSDKSPSEGRHIIRRHTKLARWIHIYILKDDTLKGNDGSLCSKNVYN
jgi:hypothetical protein